MQELLRSGWRLGRESFALLVTYFEAIRLIPVSAHFEGLKTGLEAGFWKMGGKFHTKKWGRQLLIFSGALLDEVPAEGEGLKIQGSAMVALASSKEEVLEQLKNDIYAKSDVWDFSKVSTLDCLPRII